MYLFFFKFGSFGLFTKHLIGCLDHLPHLIMVITHKLKHNVV